MTGKEFKENKQKMFQDIQDSQPTAIVLPFKAAKHPNNISKGALNLVERLNNLNEEKTLDELVGIIGADIVNILRTKKPCLWQGKGVLVANQNCLIFRTKNIFQTNKTLLTSNTRTTTSGLTESVPNLLDFLKRFCASKLITCLIISGCHGNLADGLSGFTKKELLDYKLYEATCKVVGSKAEDMNISSTPIPKPQRMYIDAIDDALLRQPPYINIKFNVLYIKHFHQKSQALLDFVEELGPSAIILDWCFTKNGDVANLLTKAGIVSRMWLIFERTSIVGMTGNGLIELSNQQTEALRDMVRLIEKGHLNGVILVGGHGTGKPLLGCEVAKIKMAVLSVIHEVFDFYCVDCGHFATVEYSSILKVFKNNVFINEDCANEKYFWTKKNIEEECGMKGIWSLKDIIRAFQQIFKKQNKTDERQKIILLDELPAGFLLQERSVSNAFDIEMDQSIFIIGCISPVIDKDERGWKKRIK